MHRSIRCPLYRPIREQHNSCWTITLNRIAHNRGCFWIIIIVTVNFFIMWSILWLTSSCVAAYCRRRWTSVLRRSRPSNNMSAAWAVKKWDFPVCIHPETFPVCAYKWYFLSPRGNDLSCIAVCTKSRFFTAHDMRPKADWNLGQSGVVRNPRRSRGPTVSTLKFYHFFEKIHLGIHWKKA